MRVSFPVPRALAIALGLVAAFALGWVLAIAVVTPPVGPSPLSIMVLPLEGQGGDPASDRLAEQLTEEVVTKLSRFSQVVVTERQEEKEVRYLLEGSVRRSGDTLRLEVELLRAGNRSSVWQEQYEKPLGDQSRLSTLVVGLIVSKMRSDVPRFTRKIPQGRTAHECVLEGREELGKVCAACNLRAHEWFTRAIETDSSHAPGYVWLGRTYYYGFTRNYPPVCGAGALDMAIEHYEQGIALDPAYGDAYAYLGIAEIRAMRFEDGMDHLRRASKLNPASAEIHYYLGNGYFWLGQHQRTLDEVEQALELDPDGPANWYMRIAWAHYFLRQYDMSLNALDRGFDRAPEFILLLNILIAVHAERGQLEQAREVVQRTLALHPHYSIAWVNDTSPFKHQADRDRFGEALRRAGVPEGVSRTEAPCAEVSTRTGRPRWLPSLEACAP